MKPTAILVSTARGGVLLDGAPDRENVVSKEVPGEATSEAYALFLRE
jgi:hypothetical protein